MTIAVLNQAKSEKGGAPLKGIICEECRKPILHSNDAFVEEFVEGSTGPVREVILCGDCWMADAEELPFEGEN